MFRSWFALAIALHVVLATSYAWRTPDFEAPDENAHYEYAQHIANAHRLPFALPLALARGLPQTDGAVLGHHPPLYYALLASVLAATGRDDTTFGPKDNTAFGQPGHAARHLKYEHGPGGPHPVLFALRLVSVALGAVSLLLVHRFARTCCPARPRIADLAALLVACLPMWSFLHGALNNDVLATTLACAVLLVLARMLLAERSTLARATTLGALLGAALLTKLTTLFLLPLAALVLAIVWRREARAGCGAPALAHAGAALVVIAALAGWWFVRNGSLYGDPLALAVHDLAFQPIPPDLRWGFFTGRFLPEVFASLLGTFGWFALPPHPALLVVGAAVTALSLTGLAVAVLRRDRDALPRAGWLSLAAMALVFAGAARFNWTAPQPQGRLLFPAIAPAAALLAAGLVRIGDGWTRRRAWLPALPLTALLVFVAWFRPAFAPELAPAPPSHRSLVGHILHPANTTIGWRNDWTLPLGEPPLLRWHDPDAPAGTRYTLYAFEANGRIRLATHEWSKGAVVLQGSEAALLPGIFDMLPSDTDLSLVLRRVPTTPDERPRHLPATPPLPFRRS